MPIYVPISNTPLQLVDASGPLSGATLSFFVSGTSTPTNLFSDNAGTSIGTSITTNSEGYPESGGNVITLFRDTAIDYKIELDDGSVVWTSDGLNSELDVLASTANGEGASLVGVEDSAGNFTGTTVEAVLAEIQATIDGLKTSGSWTAALTGYASNPTGTMNWYKYDDEVRLILPAAISGTSNATSMTITDLPAVIQTTTTQSVPCVAIRDSGVDFNAGYAVVTGSSSVITMALGRADGGTAFTASGTKGLTGGWTIAYSVN